MNQSRDQILKYGVFICYKRLTARDYAISLKEGLEEYRITAFLDIRDIPKKFKGTDEWWKCRDQAIIDCDTFLMIVTRGFEKSSDIQREITLALREKKDFMCLRRRILPPDITIELPQERQVNLKDYQQIPFDTPEELLRSVLDNLIEPKQKMVEETPPTIKQLPAGERRRFPIVHFTITQAVQNNPRIKRKLPDIGFNMRSWNDSPIMARVEARILLGKQDLGLVKGGQRAGKYMGYYDGKTLWNLNPYQMVFGHFNVPKICVTSDENLRIEVKVTLIEIDGREHDLLPVGWTFMRNRNDWFFEPTGDC